MTKPKSKSTPRPKTGHRDWTFRSNKGEAVTVSAASERDARHTAMVELWGPPTSPYGPLYYGAGLSLLLGEKGAA